VSFATVIKQIQSLDNPYPGLRPFETSESHLFFGRDQQIAQVVGRLERNRFLAVLGVSGSGKSSLVRAGLIPALERGSVAEPSRRWRIVVTRPAGAPFDSLATALTKEGLDPSSLADSSHGLVEVTRQLGDGETLLVIVDQFEELFRYKDTAPVTEAARREANASAAVAAEFVQLLLAAGHHYPPVFVVLTMRSDYLGDCAEFRDLPETLNDCQYLLPRMTRGERKRAIEGPLGRVEIAPSLVQRLLNDAGDEPDQLPVLQHALLRTWSQWRKRNPDHTQRIELSDYLDIGGFGDALNRHADELLAGVPSDIAATVFKRLTARGRGRRERRDPATLSELWAVCEANTQARQDQVTAVVERFRGGEATFLAPRDGAIGANTYVDITHESLIRQWRKLRDEWLPEEERSAKNFLDLADRARRWSQKQAELLTGADLAAAIEWNQYRNKSSAWAEHYVDRAELPRVLEFITASEAHRREVQAKAAGERRRLRFAIGVAVAAIVAGLSLIGFYQYSAAQAARRSASQARILSAPSVRDPLVRALLLSELSPYATPAHLAIYEEAAALAIPLAVRRHPSNSEAMAIGLVDDGHVAVAFSDGRISLWRDDGRDDAVVLVAAQSSRPAAIAKASPWITAAAFSADGQWIALGFCNDEVWVHRIQSLKNPQHNVTPADKGCSGDAPATALSFSRDGQLLAAGSRNAPARIWRLDGAEGALKSTPTLLGGDEAKGVSSVDVDPSGQRIATGSYEGTLRIWSIDGKPIRTFSLGGIDGVADAVFSPDGKWVLCAYDSGVARLWRSEGEGTTHSVDLLGHTAGVTSVAFSPDGARVVTASRDRTTRIWMLRSESSGAGQPPTLRTVASPRILTHDAMVTSAAFSRDGRTLVTVSADATVRMWPTEPGEPRILGAHDNAVESVTFSPDGRHIASGSDDQTARVWSLDDPSKDQILKGHGDWVRSVAFNPTDQRQLVTASDDGTLRIWEWEAAGKSRVSAEQTGVFAASFDPSGTQMVTAVRDSYAHVWKVANLLQGGWHRDIEGTNEVVRLRHNDWVLGAAFSKDGTQIVTASKDGTVSIWSPDRRAQEPTRQFRDRNLSVVFSAAFSPDGSRIVTGSSDGLARIWRIEGLDDPVELRHWKDVKRVAFSSNGESILTASMDGTARVWNAETGTERLVLSHGAEPVMAAAFDSADSQVVTGTREGVVRLWRVTLPALTQYLHAATTACLTPAMRVQFLDETDAQAVSTYTACENRYGRTPTAAGIR
jgi:WD40 repeat protein